jgi:hypothetical protein
MIKVAKTRSFRGKNWEARREKAPRASRLHNPGNALPPRPELETGEWRIMERMEMLFAECSVSIAY